MTETLTTNQIIFCSNLFLKCKFFQFLRVDKTSVCGILLHIEGAEAWYFHYHKVPYFKIFSIKNEDDSD